MRVIGAGMAIAGIVPATLGGLYLLGGTWLVTSPQVTISMVLLGSMGWAMVGAGVRLWNKPRCETRRCPQHGRDDGLDEGGS